MYTVYILRCADDTLYTGITTDLARRIGEHHSSRLGAKYLRGRSPTVLVYSKDYPSRSLASQEESRIKRLPRASKLALITSQPHDPGPGAHNPQDRS